MNKTPHENLERQPVGTLVDFVTGVGKDNPLDIEIAVNDSGRVVVFHDKPFKGQLSWYEYDLKESRLDFIMDDGNVRNFGFGIPDGLSKHMQNTHQILTVLMDDKTGEAVNGIYIPLILHRT
jgi:hypothetical protein